MKQEEHLSSTQFKIMAILEKHGPVSGRELGTLFEEQTQETIPQGTTYSLLRRLHGRRMIDRKPRRNGTEIDYSVTKKGIELIVKSRSHFALLAEFQL